MCDQSYPVNEHMWSLKMEVRRFCDRNVAHEWMIQSLLRYDSRQEILNQHTATKMLRVI